jgi:signal transduction histidine kinase
VSNEAVPPRTPRPSLRRLAEAVLEVPDLDSLTALLTRELPATAGVGTVSLLLWDRKLESFESLAQDGVRRKGVAAGASPAVSPEARYLLSEGHLIDTGRGESGTLAPLQARSGLVGMLQLGPRTPPRDPPFSAVEVRRLSALARSAALALENHLYQREMIASERLTALGTMAGMLVHDFRGPMTVIRGYAETLLDPALAREEVQQRATLITEMVDRLERMTTETLDFARGGGRVVRRSVGLNKLLTTLVGDLGAELPGLEIVARVGIPSDLHALLDVDKLRRAIGNLAANARDAMGGKGRFHLDASLVKVPRHDGPGADTRLVLLMADEGPGVPAEIRETLFEPFVTRGKKAGTGLGLAVARRFVEDHGGTLELLPGAPGARFRLTLSLTPPPAPAGP